MEARFGAAVLVVLRLLVLRFVVFRLTRLTDFLALLFLLTVFFEVALVVAAFLRRLTFLVAFFVVLVDFFLLAFFLVTFFATLRFVFLLTVAVLVPAFLFFIVRFAARLPALVTFLCDAATRRDDALRDARRLPPTFLADLDLVARFFDLPVMLTSSFEKS